jgi:hypothetical protein
MIRRLVALALCALFTVGVLAGCTDSKTKTKTAEQTQTEKTG